MHTSRIGGHVGGSQPPPQYFSMQQQPQPPQPQFSQPNIQQFLAQRHNMMNGMQQHPQGAQPGPHSLGQPQHNMSMVPQQQFGMALGANAYTNAHAHFNNVPGNFVNGGFPGQPSNQGSMSAMPNNETQRQMSALMQQQPRQHPIAFNPPTTNIDNHPSNAMQTPQHRTQIDIRQMAQNARALNEAISAGEERIEKLRTLPGPAVAAEISLVQKEVEARRMAFSRITQLLKSYGVGVGANGSTPGALSVNMNSLAAPFAPQQRNPIGPQHTPQANWMQQQGSAPAIQQHNSSPRQHGQPMVPPQPNSQVHTTSQLTPMIANQPGQRTATTPLQVSNAPHGISQSPSHSMSGLLSNGPMGGPLSQAILTPLSPEQFKQTYIGQWLTKQPPKDQSILEIEKRKIDLYRLHCEVMSAGSYRLVNQKDLWPVISAKMGFVNFPGTATEPASSGPGIAARLEHVYKEFLLDFDMAYVRHLITNHKQQPPPKQMTDKGNAQNGVQLASLGDIKDPKLLNDIIACANLSVAEMQQRNVPPHLIWMIERNRLKLQEIYDQQRKFANGIQDAREQQQRIVSNSMAKPPPQRMNLSEPMLAAQQAAMNIQSLAESGMPSMMQSQPMPSGMQSTSGMPGSSQLPVAKPSAIHTQAALEMVRRLREENKNVSPPSRPVAIADNQRLEYNASFEQLHRLVLDLDKNLPHYAVGMKEDVIKKLVLIINAVHQQRELLSSQGPPIFIMPLDWVKTMIGQVQQANRMFRLWLANIQRQRVAAATAGAHQGPPPAGPSMASYPPQQRTVQQVPQPPLPPAPAPAVASSPPAHPAHTPSAASPPLVVGTPIQKKPAPKPPADASTSSVLASPRTPKSPRPKAAAKPKQPKQPRKASTKIAAAPMPVSPSAALSEAKPPATPVNAPTPDTPASAKRQREEDTSAVVAPPAAKKIKTEWDETPDEAATKRQADAQAVKLDEEAVKFFEHMSSLLSQVGEGEGSDGLPMLVMDSLQEILKAVPSVPDDGGLPSSFVDSITVGSASPKLNASMVDPAEFFDFTSYALLPDDDPVSKAATPDLVQPSSSVGPSPDSASETEAHHSASMAAADTTKIIEPKGEHGEGADSIPQELWRAIDGGESAFYNASDNWKWDQPMPAVEQPWAFYPS